MEAKRYLGNSLFTLDELNPFRPNPVGISKQYSWLQREPSFGKLASKCTGRISKHCEGNDACRYIRHTCYSLCLFLPQARATGFQLVVLWRLYPPGGLLRIQQLAIFFRGGDRAGLASLFSLGGAHPVCSCHTVFFDASVSQEASEIHSVRTFELFEIEITSECFPLDNASPSLLCFAL